MSITIKLLTLWYKLKTTKNMKESKRTFIVEVKYPECDKLVDAENYLQELIEGDLVGEDVGRWCVNVTEVVGDIKRQ